MSDVEKILTQKAVLVQMIEMTLFAVTYLNQNDKQNSFSQSPSQAKNNISAFCVFAKSEDKDNCYVKAQSVEPLM